MLFVLTLGGGSLYLFAIYADAAWWHRDLGRETQAVVEMRVWIGNSAFYVAWLIEWAIGLRAAVTIASERERGTWDALLTSPLEGGEIVRGKLWGSLYALRWIFATALLSFTLCYVCGAMDSYHYFSTLANTLILSGFMAGAGGATSLACPTATKSMAVTIGLWLGVQAVVGVIAGILLGVIAFAILAVGAGLEQAGIPTAPIAGLFPRWIVFASWPFTYNGLLLITTLLIVADTRLRFDRIAGRMTEGRTSILLDRMVYGGPTRPVYVGEPEPPPKVAPPGEVEMAGN